MAIFVDHVVNTNLNYSMLDVGCCGFVSEVEIASRAGELKAVKKKLRLPGLSQAKETRYFFNSARILSRIAQDEAKQRQDNVIAVLFRDSDGTASAGRGLWEDKWQSIIDGFHEEGFSKGIPMIPKPKSEAWLICALKQAPYQNCSVLEDRSGSDNSPNSLKKELANIIGHQVAIELICEIVVNQIDINKIQMPSFHAFRGRLESIINDD